MARHKRKYRRWAAKPGHGIKHRHTVYATWGYFKEVAKARKLSLGEMLERAVMLYESSDDPIVKELENFQEEMRSRIMQLEYRLSKTAPSGLDEAVLDFYREILEDSNALIAD